MIFITFLFIKSEPIYKPQGSHLEISGDGTVTWSDIKSKTQFSQMKTCRINEGITILENEAFRECSQLEAISLPSSLLEISNRCFWGTNLKNLTIPKNLHTFRTTNTLFLNYNFQSFYIDPGNTNFKVYDGCLYTYNGSILISVPVTKTSISFLDGVEEIGTYCFWASNILSISVPDSVKKINVQSFVNNGKNTEILFGQNSELTSISIHTFYSIGIKKFKVPPKVSNIPSLTFYKCNELTSFTFYPNSSLNSLNKESFYNCIKLVSVELPKSIKTIGLQAFAGCIKLSSVTVEDGCENYATNDKGLLFSAGYAELIFVPPDASSLSIPSSTKSIASGILQKLTKISIDDVELVGNEFLEYRKGIFYTKQFKSAISAVGSIEEAVIHINATALEVSLFESVISLRNITFEEGSKCTIIKSLTFKGCTNLKSVAIPSEVTSLGNSAFSESGLIRVSIPKKTKTIYQACFSNTKSLQTVEFAEDSLLETIELYTFSGSSVSNITLPSKLRNLGQRVFENSGVNKIKIPNEITLIYEATFQSSKITECLFDVESKLTQIEFTSFKNCKNLKRVQIPPKVTILETTSFTSCIALNEIEFIGESTIEAIPSLVFEGCTSLSNIKFPASLRKVDASSFFGCFSLTDIDVSGSSFEFIDGCLYKENRTILVMFVPGLKDCSVLPSVETIGSNAFFGESKLETVDFGDKSSLEQIGAETFYGCSSLTVMRLPGSVKFIDSGCFKGCSKLEEWTVGDQSKLSSIGDSLFDGCTALRIVSFGKNSSLSSIGTKALAGCYSLQSISIPGNVTSIESAAFLDCTKLSGITFEHSKNSKQFEIPTECFKGCVSLKRVEIPHCVSSICSNAFNGCSKLWSALISDGVTSLGDGAFSNCGLTSVFLPSSVKSAGLQCFFSNPYLTNFTSASQQLTLGSYCFSLCSSLRFVGICSENQISGQNIFNGCPLAVVYTTSKYPGIKAGGVLVAKVMDRCLIFPTNIFTGIASESTINSCLLACLLHDED